MFTLKDTSPSIQNFLNRKICQGRGCVIFEKVIKKRDHLIGNKINFQTKFPNSLLILMAIS